ncbi:MAG: NUDIX domain-containing protein [Armatimonadetes bacterium]|nr:NUDIX domain-containing protein [Armatimonadota bacterium]
MADYNKIGLITLRDGALLLCRKRGLGALILPGGQIEAGESAHECLAREIREELGEVGLGGVEYIDTYEDIAASDDPNVVKTVSIALYRGDIIGEPVASSEIAELVWFEKESDWSELSPILLNKIMPDLIERGILPWK